MKVIVFDLDDTLYKEIDYLKSAYKEIATFLQIEFNKPDSFDFMIHIYEEGKNVFKELNAYYTLTIPIDIYLKIYRNHFPYLSLNEDAIKTLIQLKHQGYIIGLISDGRSVTQKNKIEALGLKKYLDKNLIVISEEFGYTKPDIRNYLYIQTAFPKSEYYYIGDNPKKDFIAPNSLGWETICLLDNGLNIHKQDFNIQEEYQPKYKVKALNEIIYLI